MSLMHSILNGILKKNRSFYDPRKQNDYAAARRREIAAMSRVKLPKGVSFRQEALGGVDTEWITAKKNPADRIVL